MIFKFLHRRAMKKLGLKTHSLHGHSFAYWETPMNVPYKRALAYFQAQREASLGVGEQDLRAYIEAFRKAFNEGDKSRQGALIEMLESQLSLFASWRNIFRLANALILIDDEPIKDFTPEHTKLKYDLCEGDEVIKAFFLSQAWNSLASLKVLRTNTPPWDYLNQEEVKKTEDLFCKLIDLVTYKSI